MMETLLIAIVMLMALQVLISGYILLYLSAKTEEESPAPQKRIKTAVRQSKADRAMERALDKYDGGLRR